MKKKQRRRRWYHGTTLEAASAILLTGFKAGTYFARRRKDAEKFGGPWVFTVLVHWDWKDKPKSWQVSSGSVMSPGSILELRSPKK